MWEPLQRYSGLPSEARKMFRRAALLLPAISAMLRFRGYKKTQRWLQRKLDRRQPGPLAVEETPARLEMTCRMVRAAEHYSLSRATCLEESMLLWYVLQNQGISAAIRIGVRKQGSKFEAHAWVEREGIALNQAEETHRHYEPFDDDSPARASTERP